MASICSPPFIETNWTSGIDARGRPIALKEKEPHADGRLVYPGSDGATNWMSPSFDPPLGLFYVVARRVYSIFYYTATGRPEGWAGRDHDIYEESTLRAIDYRTGEIRWNHELGPNESVAGILTTAGNLLFTGDAQGNLLVLDPATGKTLWHANAGGSMLSSPMTYELDGRQYVVEGVQGVLYAWALPE